MPVQQGSSRLRDAARRVAAFAVVGTALPAALLAAAYASGSVSTWWLELLLYVPFPAYLAPALTALALSFLLGWRWRIAAAAGVVLVATVITGLVLAPGDAGSQPLRMMTYNIKAYRADVREGGYEAILREVARHDPDILVMQDAIELARVRIEAPARVAALFDGRQVYAHGQYIVVSKLPLRECRFNELPFVRRPAGYVRCIVTAHGRDIDLVTAHLLSPREGLNAARRERIDGIDDWQLNFAEREVQARKLAADVAPRQRPLILAGDLNAPEASPVIGRLLATGLRDAFSSAGRGYGFTHGHALKPRFSFLRIDHVLVSPEIGVADSFPGGPEASEHRPVIADLLLQRGR
jgi:endonuclease/exonuclease/phosphatase (EEP) superfamily protein YafD